MEGTYPHKSNSPRIKNNIFLSFEGQVGQGSEQSGLVKAVPAHCGGGGLDDL